MQTQNAAPADDLTADRGSAERIVQGEHPSIRFGKTQGANDSAFKAYRDAFVDMYTKSPTFRGMISMIEDTGAPVDIMVRGGGSGGQATGGPQGAKIMLDDKFASNPEISRIIIANEVLHAAQMSTGAIIGREHSQIEFESDLASYQVGRELGFDFPDILGNHGAPRQLDDKYEIMNRLGLDEREIVAVSGRNELIQRYGISDGERQSAEVNLPLGEDAIPKTALAQEATQSSSEKTPGQLEPLAGLDRIYIVHQLPDGKRQVYVYNQGAALEANKRGAQMPRLGDLINRTVNGINDFDKDSSSSRSAAFNAEALQSLDQLVLA